MSILADSQIRALCILPKEISTFEEYLINLEKQHVVNGELITPKSLRELAAARIPDLEPFKLSSDQVSNLPAWLKLAVSDFSDVLEPYSKPPMIEPFLDHQVRTIQRRIRWTDEEGEATTVKVISYGLSSFGYDARLSREIKTFTNINGGEVDPKEFDESLCVKPTIFLNDHDSEYILVPPNGFVLGSTIEFFNVPRDVTVICLGKSTYARTGLVVNVTPLEAEWSGNVTLELSNTTPLPIRVYLEEGICQFLFFKGGVPCDVSYADRDGKYQGQTGVTLPKV
jgi:dCTP deaminase